MDNIIFWGIVIFCIWAVWMFVKFFRSLDDDEQSDYTQRHHTPTHYQPKKSDRPPPRVQFGDENIYPDDWRRYRLSERDRERLLKQKIQTFWHDALIYSIQYIEQGDFETLAEFLANIWGTRDLVESADDLHTLSECVIERLYPYRENPQCRELIYTLCRLVLSNADNYIAQKKRNTIWRSPTKYAILLEKDRRYAEAIDVCDYCIARKITDFGYGSFEDRKERLLSKTRR